MSVVNSRLIVKNLPKNVTEEDITKVFSKEGVVTDLQLKHKKDGTFRHFAFVGYKTADEAQRALNAINNTYVKNSKISVEFCSPWNILSIEPDSKTIQEKNGTKAAGQNKKANNFKNNDNKVGNLEIKDEPKDDIENDPEFKEFVDLHRNFNPSKGKSWQNDDINPSNLVRAGDKSKKLISLKKKEEKTSVKGTYKNTIKLKGVPYEKCNRKCIKEFLEPLKPISLRIPRNIKSIAYAAFQTPEEVEKALAKNRNVLGGSLVTVLKYISQDFQDEQDPKYSHQKQLSKEDSEAILNDTGRIFIRNLYYSCKEEDLDELFKPYGPIAEIHLPIDKDSKRIKGFGFVSFVFPEHALKAFFELDGTIFQGRNLHLIPATSKPNDKMSLVAKSSFKKKKELEEKKHATVGHNWNALFLGINALSDVISEKYDVKKSQLLMENRSSESAAVRVALGETQIVSEMKNFLTSNGVKLDAFDQEKPKRSKTIFLIKNLPSKTTLDELQDLLSSHGTVSRIILPPMAITAIVEYENSVEAKTAFKKLAYKHFKSSPLYLEWAPMDIFSANTNDSQLEHNSTKQSNDSSSTNADNDNDNFKNKVGTVLVKNISELTNEQTLNQHFSKFGKIKKVYIARKKNSDGTTKSLGYGFVEFKNRKEAEAALKNLQNLSLNESNLELSLSTKNYTKEPARKLAQNKGTNNSIQSGTKILVRNIPFEATEKEVEQLFSVFGRIKSLRLPKKLTGYHRGFGFVDFLTKEDAKRAFESLSLSTHLLGRRLVLEWSNDEEDSEVRTSKVFNSSQQFKRLKKSNLLSDLESATKPRNALS